jgi:N-acetylmuramoyl-L-alanine amidase
MNETMIEISESSFGDETPQVKSEPDKEVKKTNTKAPAKSNIVVLDPGHGGQDPGAVANGIQEKNINLSIALKLEKTLESKGIKVELTRRTDVYLKLAERTEIANKLNAEVFVSIHANALPKGKSARGFEIYLMALPTDKDALELAKFENRELVDGKTNAAASDKRTQLLLSILGDMQQNHKIIESTDFAEVLFKAGNQSGLPMRRVAQAPFYVLRGAAMPAVLLETGFITDKDEAKLLSHSNYQQKIADAMALGIINYLRGK